MVTSCDLQQIRLPGYQLVAALGQGTHGQVWEARGPGNTPVAIKFVDLYRNCGHREWNAVQAVKQVRHANLMPIIAVSMIDQAGRIVHDESEQGRAVEFLEEGEPVSRTLGAGCRPRWMAIIMPLGDQTLEQRQQHGEAGGRIPADELCAYLLDAARAIDHLNQPIHEHAGRTVAIQHGDIKPANMILMGNSVQLCDFGVARILHDARPAAGLGSPAYMAPECIREGRPSHASDQYSLAITYVELRTGRLPMDAGSLESVRDAHLSGKLDLSGLSEGERRVIRKATSLDPHRRYRSATEMILEIQQALQHARETRRAVQTRRGDGSRRTRLGHMFRRLWMSTAQLARETDNRRAGHTSQSPSSTMSARPRTRQADTQRQSELRTDKVRRVGRHERRVSQPALVNESVEWFRRAADQGNAAARKNLGDCYFRGWGVAQDDRAAAYWFGKAARQGHPSAQNSLAFCYYHGRGVAKDRQRALLWFRAAAAQNHAAAQNNLGLCLRRVIVAVGPNSI